MILDLDLSQKIIGIEIGLRMFLSEEKKEERLDLENFCPKNQKGERELDLKNFVQVKRRRRVK